MGNASSGVHLSNQRAPPFLANGHSKPRDQTDPMFSQFV